MGDSQLVTDQLDRKIQIPALPERIICLVPSITELLYDFGLGDRVVGITRFCVRPESWFYNKKRVGGTKDVKIERVHELEPDLIIANKEENDKDQILELEKSYPVWVSDVRDLDDALEMIAVLGAIFRVDEKALQINRQISLSLKPISQEKKTALYLIWREPFMTVNSDTFIHDMLKRAGFSNCAGNLPDRYPELSINQIKALDPEFILLSSEPYPFKEKHISELRDLLPKANPILVDGELFSWYGSRLLYSAEYFAKQF